VLPFILIQLFLLVIAYIYPGLITWLPEQIYGK
jgi:TRAP-type mannitol/chloroaromatic compound transport system permease large subunit